MINDRPAHPPTIAENDVEDCHLAICKPGERHAVYPELGFRYGDRLVMLLRHQVGSPTAWKETKKCSRLSYWCTVGKRGGRH